MKLFPAIDNFFGGLISKSFRGRIRHALYNNSLVQCTNFKVTKEGSLETRAGVRFVQTASGTVVKLFTFKIRGREDFVAEISSAYVRLYNLAGNVLVTSGAYIQLNGSFTNGF